MGNFYTDVLQVDSRFHDAEPIRDMALLEPTFRGQVEAFMAAAKAAGTELMVTETYRSSELQQKYFDEGKTQLSKVGVHHYGLACDFAKVVDGQASWDGDWTFCVGLATRVSTPDRVVISGYDWGRPDQPHSFRDSDHIQGCTVDQQTALFAGTWYPDGTATPTVAPLPTPPAAIPTVNHAGLTDAQSAALAAFDVINAESFGNWFQRSSFMAFCETESNFDPKAFRQEPSGVASYGLMQVLDSTAAGLGLVGDPAQMYDPKVGILYGLKYASQGWNYLQTHFGRPPTLAEWSAGYNEGYGAAAQGRPDQHYVDVWTANRAKWLYLDAAASVAQPATPAPMTPTPTPPVAPVSDMSDIGAMPALETLQFWLKTDGADIVVDGRWGPSTLAAIVAAYEGSHD
jgi:hypothetical protein